MESRTQNSCDSRAQACVYLEFDRAHGFLKEGKIEFDFSKEEMQKLTPRDLHQMGLRSNQDVKWFIIIEMRI